jgi:hypothetical protein
VASSEPGPLPPPPGLRVVQYVSQLLTLWGEISMCDTPPTLIIVHFDLVQHFIEGTVLQLTTGNRVSNKLN